MGTKKMPFGVAGLILNVMPVVILGATHLFKISTGYPIQHIVAAANLLCILAALLISVTLVRKKETRTIPAILSTVLSAIYIVGGSMLIAVIFINRMQ